MKPFSDVLRFRLRGYKKVAITFSSNRHVLTINI